MQEIEVELDSHSSNSVSNSSDTDSVESSLNKFIVPPSLQSNIKSKQDKLDNRTTSQSNQIIKGHENCKVRHNKKNQ